MKTRDAQRRADVELVGRALQAYWADHKIFPPAQNARIVACGQDGAEVCEWDMGPILDSEGVVYLKKFPLIRLLLRAGNIFMKRLVMGKV